MIAGITLSGYLAHLPQKRIQVIIFLIVFILQYAAEHFYPADKNYNNSKNELKNILVGVGNGVILFVPSALIVELLSIISQNKIGLLQQITIPFWFNSIVTLATMDFFLYWWHRFNHTQKIFWRFHRFHHLDGKMNTTTALRFHIVELLFSNFFKALFFLMMGFSFLPVLIYEIVFFIIVLIQHSNINISRNFDMAYRKIFSSPLMHRIHHSNKQIETDTNYSSVFSFWDKLFRTYKKEVPGKIVFGVDENKM
ncbi:MAG: sterol desaturase family protein [Ginsengibacter sp.]